MINFAVIVGIGYDTKGLFYRFYEVGTSYKDKGVSDENKLYIENGMLQGKPTQNTNRHYVATQRSRN